jgi:hypothetical protein
MTNIILLYIYFLMLRTPLRCLHVPSGVRVPQVEYHCFKWTLHMLCKLTLRKLYILPTECIYVLHMILGKMANVSFSTFN